MNDQPATSSEQPATQSGGAQHKAKYPNSSDVSDCRTYTRDFLQKTIEQVWNEFFDSISLVDLIRDQTVKDFLAKAEAALTQGNYEESIQNANAGFSQAISKASLILLGDSFGPHLWRAEAFGEVSDALESVYDDFAQKFERVKNALVYFTLGMSHADLLRFRKIAGDVHFFYHEDDELKCDILRVKENPDRNDAEFVFAYCTDAAVQIENYVGDLGASVGLNRWY